MSQATTDPTLEELVPRGSRRRGAALVVLALAVLVGAWLLPPQLQAGIGQSQSSWGRQFTVEGQVLAVAAIQPHAWGGVEIRSVGAVPGAHVVGAWATNADLWGTANVPDAATPADLLAVLGLTDADRLPHTVAPRRDATLVVLWQIDDCAALRSPPSLVSGPVGAGLPNVVSATRWGTTHTSPLSPSPLDWYAPGPVGVCAGA
jgi:hypothetical protein